MSVNMSEVHDGCVREFHVTVSLMFVEDRAQSIERRLVVRVTGFGGVGRRQQPASYAVIIEDLTVIERSKCGPMRSEELRDGRRVHVSMGDSLEIGAVAMQQFLVRAQERGRVDMAVIPD